MRLFHFTSAVHGLAAIRTQKYKLSTFDNLNDPFELFAVDFADPEIRRLFRGFKEDFSRRQAMLCCSKSWSSTLLWSHYADRHRGVALELDVSDALVTHVKVNVFDDKGEAKEYDFPRLLNMLKKVKYKGPLSIEYEGKGDPVEGVRMTKALILKYW